MDRKGDSIMPAKNKKIAALKRMLREMNGVVLAFSGGLDSTFLLKIAKDTLGKDKVIAVTARSETFPGREYGAAKALASELDVNFMTITTKELEDGRFIKNPVDRCYYCKKELFTRLRGIAKRKKFNFVMDGYNHDDRNDLRYGHRAAKELSVRSPLAEVKIGKKEIRSFSKVMGLPTWNKPSFACLASRFPYHSDITRDKLKVIDKAEDYLYRRGFRQVRVRMHDDVARIEVRGPDAGRILKIKGEVSGRLKALGFLYVTLDLDGYRTGSMNEGMVKGIDKTGTLK